MKLLIKLSLLSTALCLGSQAFSQIGYEAETDTNGNFTWPPAIPAWQLTPFSNSIYLYTTGGALSGRIGGDGSLVITNGSTAFNFTGSNFWLTDPYGGFGYSNGVFWLNNTNPFFANLVGQINANTNLNFAVVSNVTAALNALSNQMFTLLSGSNLVYQAEFAASNSAILTALTTATNTLALAHLALIGTNGINFTNLAFALGLNQTNYAYSLITNNGALLTNLVYALGQNATNLAYGIGANDTNYATTTAAQNATTNYFGNHFRVGNFNVAAGLTSVLIGIVPGFSDANYTIYVTPAVTGGYNLSGQPPFQAQPYNSYEFNFVQAGFTNTVYYNCLIYHP